MCFFNFRHSGGNKGIRSGLICAGNQKILHDLNAARMVSSFDKLFEDTVQLGGTAKNVLQGDGAVEKLIDWLTQKCCGSCRRERRQHHPAVRTVFVVSRTVPKTRQGCLWHLCFPVQDAVALETKAGHQARVGQM